MSSRQLIATPMLAVTFSSRPSMPIGSDNDSRIRSADHRGVELVAHGMRHDDELVATETGQHRVRAAQQRRTRPATMRSSSSPAA